MIQKQLHKLKENWLLVALFLVVLIWVSGMNPISTGISSGFNKMEYAMAEPSMVQFYNSGFAPDIEERKIVQTLSLSTEVRRGTYTDNEQKLKAIVITTNSLIVNENVNTYDDSKSGYYQIQVDSSKADAIMNQLKGIGKITSLYNNKQDITNSYTDTKIELDSETRRLGKYNLMFSEAKNVDEKIQLTNLIFDQERRVKYLQERLDNQDEKVDYTTISFNMVEKQSEWANIALTSFGNLVRSLVNSINTLLHLIFVILPYAVIGLLGLFVYRKFIK